MSEVIDRERHLAWRLYRDMLLTRLFEEASVEWRRQHRVAAESYPCTGQEAIGVGAVAALEPQDAVIPSLRTRSAFVARGVPVVDQIREVVGSPLAEGGSRDAPHHASWPDRGILPGSSMVGTYLPPGAGLALAMKLGGEQAAAVVFFGDGAFGEGDFHETLNIAALWALPLVLVCENNAWQHSTSWDRARRRQSLTVYAAAYGLAAREVDGTDALDVYHSTRWARARALAGQPVLLDCVALRTGLYSTHFGDPRPDVEAAVAGWRRRDPVDRLARVLTESGLAGEADLAALRSRLIAEIAAAFEQATGEARGTPAGQALEAAAGRSVVQGEGH